VHPHRIADTGDQHRNADDNCYPCERGAKWATKGVFGFDSADAGMGVFLFLPQFGQLNSFAGIGWPQPEQFFHDHGRFWIYGGI